MSHFINTFVSHYGLLAIFVIMTAESCGIPFPSEVTMPLAGALAFGHRLSLVLAITSGILGNIFGGVIAYWLAAQFGTSILLGPGRYVGISKHHLELADTWFQKHGGSSVFVGRLLPVLRTYISFPAGLARMQFGGFLVASLIGCAIWDIALALGGFLLGSAYSHIAHSFTLATVLCALILVGLAALLFVRGRMPSREVK